MLEGQRLDGVRGDPSGASGGASGRVPAEGCVLERPKDIESMVEALIRAHALERRAPGGGRWPFAGDGPWHLIQPEVGDVASDADYSETLIVNEAGRELQVRKLDSREPRPPLDAAEVAELAQLHRWLLLVPERDRKLVWVATARLHAGEGRVPWKAVGRWLGLRNERTGKPLSPDGVMLRYRQAVARAVCALNGWPERRAKAMAA